MKPYNCIIFDWDGTLIDSVPRIVLIFEKTFAKLELPAPCAEDVKPLIGLPLAEACHRLHPSASATELTQMVEIYRFFWLHPDIPLSPLVEGVPQLLEDLKQAGYVLAVATGKSRHGLERELNVYQLAHYFSATRCAAETKAKPDPEMLEQLLAELSFKAEATLMIGDTGLDLAMARNAHIDAVGVLTGGHTPASLAAFEPKAILDDAVQLAGFLAQASEV